MKKVKGFLIYLFTYVLITVATAVGVVLISNPAGATTKGKVEIETPSQGATTAPQINYIVDNFSTINFLTLNLSANINFNNTDVTINFLGNVNLEDKKNIMANGTIIAKINSNAINIDFTYLENTIYLSMFNGNFKINTNNIMGSVTQILSLLNIEMPNLGMDFGNLDISTILGMFSNLTETKTSNNTTLEIALPMVGNLTVVCDLNYGIKTISLPKTTIDGISFEINGEINYPENVEIIKPDKEFIEATELFNILEALVNTLKTKQIGLNINFNYNDLFLSGKVNLDLENYNLSFETEILDTKLNLVVTNNIIYFDYGNIYLKFNLSDISLVNDLLINQFNVNIPINEILAILESFKTGKFDESLKNINLSNLDFSSIDLSIIENFSKLDDNYSIKLKNIGEVLINVNNKLISKIEFDGYNIKFDAAITTANEIKTKNVEYANLKNVIPALDAVLNTIKQNSFMGTINVLTNNFDADINYFIRYDKNNFVAEFDTTLFNKKLKLTIINNNIYLEYSNLKIKASINDLKYIIENICTQFNINLNSIEIDKITSLFKEIINPFVNPYLITNLKETNNGLEIELINKLKLNLEYGKTLKNIQISFNNITLYASILANNTNITLPMVNDNEFTSILEFNEIATNLINYFNDKQFNFNLNMVIGNYVLTGFVGYNNNNLMAELKTSIENKEIVVKILNNKVYAEIDGLNLCVNLNEVENLINFVNDKLNLNLNFNEALNFDNLKNLIFELINTLEISYEHQTLNIYNDSINLNINFKNLQLNEIKLAYLDNVNINIIKTNQITPIKLAESYFNVIDALPFVDSLINTYNFGKFDGRINLIINGTEINVDYKIAILPKLQVWAKVNVLGTEIKVNVYENCVYLQIKDLLVKFDLSDMDYLINYLETNFGDIINFKELSNSLSNINFSLKDITNLFANNNFFSVNINGIGLSAEFTDVINKISVNYENFNLNFVINNIGSSVQLPTINTSMYEDIKPLLSGLQNIIDIVKTKNIELFGTINYNNLIVPLTVQLNYENSLKIKATIVVLNKTLEIYYINNFIYVNFDGLKLKYDITRVDELFNELKTNFGFDISKILNTDLLNNLSIVNISKTAIDNFSALNVGLQINNLNLNVFVIFDNLNLINEVVVNLDNLKINLSINKTNRVIDLITEDYKFNLNDFVSIITPVKNLMESKTFEFNGNIKLKLLGYDQDLKINYLKLDITEFNSLKLSLNFEFNGVNAKVHLQNNIIYLEALGLKVKLPISDIDSLINWAKETFNVEINISNNLDINKIINSIYFGSVSNLNKTPTGLIVQFENNVIQIDYNNTINKIYGNLLDFNFNLNLINFNNVSFDNIISNEYSSIEVLTDFVSTIINYVNTKQYNLIANAKVYNDSTLRFDAKANLQMDFKNKFGLYAYLSLSGEQNINLTANIYNDYFYADYNNLKLKINKNDLSEILVVILNMLGIDPNILPFLTDAINGMDVNFDNISNIFPNIDFNNPLSLIKIVKNLEFNDNNLKITLDGSFLTNNPNAKEMAILIKTNNNMISNISINNLYTGVTENEYFNLFLDFLPFNGLTTPDLTKNYIDISNSNELIKAIINTAELNNYEIEGSLKINGNLVGIDINWNVPFNLKIKLNENRVPEIMAVIGEIPTLIGVNNDVPYKAGDTESGSGRMLYIYYKDGYVYFYRTEYVDIMFGISKRKYEKQVKVHISDVLNDPLKYVQYGIGFTDTIIDAIKESISKANGHTPNLGNIINSFTCTDAMNFSIDINLQELTNDNKMDNLVIGLGVINNESTNNKNYIGKASLSMFMPLASVFDLTLYSNNISLINIGKNIDLSSLYNFVDNYKYNESAEWEASDGNWKKSSEVLYTIRFVTNNGTTLNNISQAANTSITLPTFKDEVIDDGQKIITRHFVGWYENEDFSGEKVNYSLMPRRDKNLYTCFIETYEFYRTISFVSEHGEQFKSKTILENSNLVLPTYTEEFVETIGNITTTYKFAGWYTDNTFEHIADFNLMPNKDITLYALWEIIKVEETHAFNVYDGNELLVSKQLKKDVEINLAGVNKINDKTLFYLESDFKTPYSIGLMPNEDLTLYVRNYYTFNVVSEFGNSINKNVEILQGSNISIPAQTNYYEDDGTQTKRDIYTFNGYTVNGKDFDISLLQTMPNYNLTVKANWVKETKLYYTVNFDLRFYLVLGPCVAGYKLKEAATPIAPIKVLDGTTLDLTNYAPTCRAWGTAFHIGNGYLFKATSWGVNSAFGDYTAAGSGVKEVTITNNTTLYACWEKV